MTLDEDSPDLTPDMIAGALKLGPIDVGGFVEASRCPHCAQGGVSLKYSIRRHKPHMYMLISQTCASGHKWDTLFESDWL